MPLVIGMIISSGKATLRELQEYYSLEDAYNLMEVTSVDIENESRVREWQQQKL